MTTLEALISARAEIDRGWCKHVMENSRGEVCAVGAIGRVCEGDNRLHLATVAALEEVLPGDCPVVQIFNDRCITEKADVLALFDRAANALVPVGDPSHVYRTVA